MGLRPLPTGRTNAVIVGDSTYNMREMVSVAEMEKSRTLMLESITWLERAQNIRNNFASGGDGKLSDVRQAIEQANAAALDIILIWLESWSHDDAIDRSSVVRLDNEDRDAITDYIGQKIRRGDDDEKNPTETPALSFE